MPAPLRSRAAPWLLLPLLGVVAAGCQLCGLEPPRCQAPNDDFRACGPDDYCADDGFCRPVPRAPVRGECAERGGEAEVRQLRVGFGTGGAAAMGERLGEVEAVLSCGADFSACGLQASGAASADAFVPVTLRGADDPGTTPVLDTVAYRTASRPLAIEDGFALEVVFRAPSTPVAAPIVAMSDGANGWELGADAQGNLGFAVGDQVLGLSYPTLRTWHHALCLADTPSLLAGGDDDDLLCVLDGVLLQTRFTVAGLSAQFGGPLSVGSYDDGAPVADSAVASLRLWPGDPFPTAVSSSARQDALVDAANARLARFHGIGIDAPSETLRIARLGFDFAGVNVKLQPITRAGITRFEIVPTRWPRTALAGGEVGLLVETIAEDLAAPLGTLLPCYGAAPVGSPATGPGGVPGGCDVGSSPFSSSGAAASTEAFVVNRDDLSFSVFVARSSTATLTIDDTTCAVADGTLDDSGRGSGECRLIEDFADGFVRLVARAARPPENAAFAATFTGIVWSPQLEVGADATTPFVVPVATGEGFVPSSYRILDLISLERLGLTRGSATSAVVTMVPLGDLDIGEVILSESTDLLRNLVLNIEEDDPGVINAGGLLQDDFTPIEMRGPAVTWDGSSPLTFGVDLGTPVVRCGARCNAGVGAGNTESPGQWEVLKVSGRGAPFVLTEVDVATRGTPPLEVAFELKPEVAPTGCFEGRYADVALVGCDSGACTEGTSSRVVWTGTTEGISPGPGLEELAVAGALSAERLNVDVEALYFEVRFQAAGDGTVFALEDAEGPFLSVSVEDGVLQWVRRDTDAVAFEVFDPSLKNEDDPFMPYHVVDGTWVQASCFVGPQTACATNMDYLRLSNGEPLDTTILRARAGEAAAAVAFARVWAQSADTTSVDVIRLSSERIARSFGLGMVPRRSPTLVVEGRTVDAELDREGASLVVGPAWPRVTLVDGAPAYLSDVDADEQLSLAFAFDLVGENRGLLDVELAGMPAANSWFYVVLDASDPSGGDADYLTFAVAEDAARLRRGVDADTSGGDPAIVDDVIFESVRSPAVELSWRGGVMTAEGSDGSVSVQEVVQFPLLGFVNSAAFGSGRSDGVVEAKSTALRHLRLSSR